jgi:hypothetical protein
VSNATAASDRKQDGVTASPTMCDFAQMRDFSVTRISVRFPAARRQPSRLPFSFDRNIAAGSTSV